MNAARTRPARGAAREGHLVPRCVAFDAVGTLMHPSPDVATVYHQVARRHGSRLERRQIAERFRRAFSLHERQDLLEPGGAGLATSESRERQRWQSIVRHVIDDVPRIDDCFEELFQHFGRASAWACYADVAEGLSRLRALGVELAIASNFDRRLHAVVDGLPELRGITCRVVSSEIGYRKPAPRFFEQLLRATGCQESDLLMVGDDRVNDIDAARVARIPAILLDRSAAPGCSGPPHGIASDLIELANWLSELRAAAHGPDPAAPW